MRSSPSAGRGASCERLARSPLPARSLLDAVFQTGAVTSFAGPPDAPPAAGDAVPVRPRRRRLLLVAIAACWALLLGVFLFFFVVVPQTPARLEKTSAQLDHRLALWRWLISLSLPKPHGSRLLAALLVAVFAAFALYAVAILAARAVPASRRLLTAVVAGAVVFTALASLALPNLDTDVYTYIATGRVAAVQHRDPYAHATDQFPTDPYFRFELPQYTHYPDIKLPAWMPINIGLAEVAGNDPATGLLVYRGAFAGFGLASLALVLLIVRRLAPRRMAEAAIAWGWNPLVVLFAQSKVDIVMVFFLLASILALTAARRQLGVLFMTLATLVKLLTAPFLALLLLGDVRGRRWRRLIVSIVVILGTIAVLYSPYSHTTRLLARHFGLAGTAGAGGTQAGGGRALLLLVGACVIVLLALRRERMFPEQLRLWALIGVAVGVVVVAGDFPWYLLTFVALVVVAGDLWLTGALAALGLLSLAVYERHSNSTHAHPLPHLSTVSLGVFVLFLGAVGAALAGIVRMRSRHLVRSAATPDSADVLRN